MQFPTRDAGALCCRRGSRDADHDLASSLACPEVSKRVRDPTQRILPIDHRGELPGFDQLLQHDQIVMPYPGQEPNSLAPAARQELRLDQAPQRCPKPARRAAEHQFPARSQDTRCQSAYERLAPISNETS